jgi:hypothetical protein
MPLHDWTDRPGWDGLHLLWISELLRWIKPRLPERYRAFVGTTPTVGIGAPPGHADVSVRQSSDDFGQPSPNGPTDPEAQEPDEEIAVATLESSAAVLVELEGRLVAAIELVSPRNKDRPAARAAYLGKYFGYVLEGVHLLLVDLHSRPTGFSFADELARELKLAQPSLPPPFAVGYRVGERSPSGGRFLAVWRRPLAAGQALPVIPLALNMKQSVMVDLGTTYQAAARDAYLT